MENVILKLLHHRSVDCIGIYFTINNQLQSIVQNKVGARWSKTHHCWYIKLSQQNYLQLATLLKGKATLLTGELKSFLDKRKEKQIVAPLVA